MRDLILLKDKILLFVEDDKVIRDNTNAMLSFLFNKVILANNGEEALEKYIEYKPDMILTDIKMPKKDGLQLIEEIREEDIYTPIVLFTAHNEQRFLMKAINMSVDGYILKPVTLDNILEVFSRCTKKLKQNIKNNIVFSNGAIYSQNLNEIILNGESIALSSKERTFLNLAISKYPNITTKEDVISKVWANSTITDSAIKNIVSRIRTKIGYDSLVCIAGIGWRLEIKDGSG